MEIFSFHVYYALDVSLFCSKNTEKRKKNETATRYEYDDERRR
jgi:hypothetical protein